MIESKGEKRILDPGILMDPTDPGGCWWIRFFPLDRIILEVVIPESDGIRVGPNSRIPGIDSAMLNIAE